MLFALSPRLLSSSTRPTGIDIAITLVPLLLFQFAFYHFGRRWTYTTDAEHVANISKAYDPDGRIEARLER